MTITNPQIGMKVKAIEIHDGTLPVGIGIIKSVDATHGQIGVEFEDWTGGHDCNGKCKPQHGWAYTTDGYKCLDYVVDNIAEKPAEKIIVFKDKQFLKECASIEEAEKLLPDIGTVLTVYKIIPISTIEIKNKVVELDDEYKKEFPVEKIKKPRKKRAVKK